MPFKQQLEATVPHRSVSGTTGCLSAPTPLCPDAPYLLSIASMVSTRGALRVSARKQTASPARIEVAPKPTGGRMALNSPSVVTRGAARPPKRALTEAKPIPICLRSVGRSVAMAWSPPEGQEQRGLGVGGRAGRDEEPASASPAGVGLEL